MQLFIGSWSVLNGLVGLGKSMIGKSRRKTFGEEVCGETKGTKTAKVFVSHVNVIKGLWGAKEVSRVYVRSR